MRGTQAVWVIGAGLGMWVLAAGCDKKDAKPEPTPATSAGVAATSAPVATSAKPAPSAAPPASTVAAATADAGEAAPVATTMPAAAGLDSTGVPECDIFVAALKCFVDKTGKEKEVAVETHDAVKKAFAASPGAQALLAKRCMEGYAIAQDDLATQGCAPPASAHPTTVTLQGGAKPTTATLPAAVDSDPDPHMAHAGHCKRFKADGKAMCQYGSEYCCENVATGEAKCQPRATREGRSYVCSNDGNWRIAMECSQYTGCGGKKCCVEEPVPGFLQTVCKDSCGTHGEACIGSGGACKDPSGFKCVAAPNSRAGGRCVATGEKNESECDGCMWRNHGGMCIGGCADDQKCVNHQCL